MIYGFVIVAVPDHRGHWARESLKRGLWSESVLILLLVLWASSLAHAHRFG